MATTPIVVYNHDIVGFYYRINKFVVELVKSASSNVSQLNAYDRARLGTYLLALRAFHDWVLAQPHLDLPETTPREYKLDEPEPAVSVENDEVDDIVRMLVLARQELTNSQSARLSSGLIPFDATRFAAIITKVENFLVQYVDKATPLDLPESSPVDVISGTGRTGV